VKLLAKRLHEANKVAGRQSKLSHETAKRYYYRQAKLGQFNKGDFVYVHYPTYKRSKARKFSYQYKGTFEVEQKISPLICKVRMVDGTSATIHINRLKRAYEQMKSESALPLTTSSKDRAKLKDSKVDAPREYDGIRTEKSDVEIRSHLLTRDAENNESDESDDDVKFFHTEVWKTLSGLQSRRTYSGSSRIATQLMILHMDYVLG